MVVNAKIKFNMMSTSAQTIDHKKIQKWVEEREGIPAKIKRHR